MPATLDLTHEGYVLHYTIADPLDITELLLLYRKERELRDNTPHTLHSVTDFTQLRAVPRNWLSARSGPGLTHPRSGEMVFVGIQPGIRIVLDAILRITGYRRIKSFKTMPEAQTYLKTLVAETKARDTAAAG